MPELSTQHRVYPLPAALTAPVPPPRLRPSASASGSVPEFSKPMSDPAEGSADGVLAPGALGEDVLDLFLDLGPFLNTSYHVVQVGVRRRVAESAGAGAGAGRGS